MSEQAQHARARGAIDWVQRAINHALGLLSLIVGLSILASLPVIQILALGYLLVAGARVAARGRLRDALPALDLFARLGAIVLGFWLLLWIPRLLSSLAGSAALIDPTGDTAGILDALAIALALLLGLHGVAACLRGARLRHMLLPRPRLELRALRRLATAEGYRAARDAVWEALAALEPLKLVKVGLLGFVCGIAWLLIPTSLLALGSKLPALAVIGCVLIAIVVGHLPFIQLHVAEQGRLAAMFELDAVRRARAGAPLATAAAVLLTVTSSLPLYLLKIELIPREAMWLPGILFVALMLPARLACSWALARGRAREQPRHWSLRALGRMLAFPAVLAYGVVLYFTQYVSWYGSWSLYEQHTFLLPVPFLGG